MTARLARPVSRLKGWQPTVPAVVLAMVGAGVATLMRPPEGGRLSAMLGQTWWICPWMLVVLSLHALACILWALGGLAPTRLA